MLTKETRREDLFVSDIDPDVSLDPPMRVLMSSRTKKSAWGWSEGNQHPIWEAGDLRHYSLQKMEEAALSHWHCKLLTRGQMIQKIHRTYYIPTDRDEETGWTEWTAFWRKCAIHFDTSALNERIPHCFMQ
ncbi:MAG: hypothetical protein WAX80_01030 [Minisyncoccia bacterium]